VPATNLGAEPKAQSPTLREPDRTDEGEQDEAETADPIRAFHPAQPDPAESGEDDADGYENASQVGQNESQRAGGHDCDRSAREEDDERVHGVEEERHGSIIAAAERLTLSASFHTAGIP
jgi:hypothetical protein